MFFRTISLINGFLRGIQHNIWNAPRERLGGLGHLSISILAGLICVPLALCARYAFSRNDPLPGQRGKAYGCTVSLQTEQKKSNLRFLTALPSTLKGNHQTLKERMDTCLACAPFSVWTERFGSSKPFPKRCRPCRRWLERGSETGEARRALSLTLNVGTKARLFWANFRTNADAFALLTQNQ